MNLTKSILVTLAIYLVSASLAYASASAPMSIRSSAEIENSCRAKSKEIALETYRGCVTDTKTAQIEQVRRQYKVKLLALKAYYENELKKMNNQSAKAAPVAAAAPAPAQPAVASAVQTQSEVQVQLKPATSVNVDDENVAPAADESAPDMPEPIPVQTK
jgi:hypothetical protein